MQTKFDKMRAHRVRWVAQPIKAQEAAPQVPSVQPFMVVDGVAYVEAPATMLCEGCAFYLRPGGCGTYLEAARAAFGRDCSSRVIYLKAE
jgi:hypothetical protein